MLLAPLPQPEKEDRTFEWGPVLLMAVLLTGCHSHQQPVYQHPQGFRFTPPPGWVERARDDAVSAKSLHGHQDLPLPPLSRPGKSGQESLLVRYDRLTSGHLAWLRVTVTDLPAASPLDRFLSARSPGPNWKRESEIENLEVSGLAAARLTLVGRWRDQDYLNETVAVRQAERVYVITASFPASDSSAREQVRRVVESISWKS